jgi:hypothetical protein
VTKIREELQYDGYDLLLTQHDLLLTQPTPPAIALSELPHAGDEPPHAAARSVASVASVSAAEGRVVDLDL